MSEPARVAKVPFTLDPDRASIFGKLGAHSLHASRDSREITANARRAALDRFLTEVDPDSVLPEAERQRRAEHAKKAHFLKMALRSADVRRSKKANTTVSTT